MSVHKKTPQGVKCTDATGRDGASERVTASVSRGDLHPDVVAVDEGNVVGHFTGDGPLKMRDVG